VDASGWGDFLEVREQKRNLIGSCSKRGRKLKKPQSRVIVALLKFKDATAAEGEKSVKESGFTGRLRRGKAKYGPRRLPSRRKIILKPQKYQRQNEIQYQLHEGTTAGI